MEARKPSEKPTRLCISLDQDGLTKGYQIAIEERDAKGNGTGTRLAGPKYSGAGRNIMRAYLDEHGANAVRRYLDKHFPQKDVVNALHTAEHALLNCGFVGSGEHGTGDPEINKIKTALKAISHD